MPSASAATRSPRARPAARRRSGGVPLAAAAGRVRWDRVGRIAMLLVAAALIYLYLSAGVKMFSTWSQSRHDSAAVASLQAEHRRLVAQHHTLASQSRLEEEARKLGMMHQGEQPYVIGHLPEN